MFVQQFEGGSRLVTSASDLTAASACEFAFLRRVDARLGRDVVVPADDDPMLARAAQLGDAHEARVLAEYRREFGARVAEERGSVNSGGVVEIARANPRDEAELAAAQEATLAALRGGADIVFQATFFDPDQAAVGGEVANAELGSAGVSAVESRRADALNGGIAFLGYADFLARTADGSYEVQDTKLARKARVTALMQLAAYAEQLERLEVPVSPEVVLILGDGARSSHRLADIAPVFRARRARLHTLLRERAAALGPDGRRESGAPVRWGAAGIAMCGRCEVCTPEIERTRDPLLIAGIRVRQRDAFIAAGLDTIDLVAAEAAKLGGSTGAGVGASAVTERGLSTDHPTIDGMAPAVFERLVWQAALQVEGRGAAIPPYRVVAPLALAAIPSPNPGDLFFDFEGDPLYREADRQGEAKWGIDYLFGMVDTLEQFTALWAHDLAAERRALREFLSMLDERRRKFPGMKVYHYAPYERAHLLSIAARHGEGEAEVDRLLREHVLVDLYPIVRAALRVGSRSYSIKMLEPLYMGDELRDPEGVTTGAQSVSAYAEAMALRRSDDPADRAAGQTQLEAIGDYNRYDCVSTLRLRDWLLRLAAEHGLESLLPGSSGEDDEPATSGDADAHGLELSPLGAALSRHASLARDPRDRRAAALAGSAIDYYEREQKSFWWAHFSRLVDPIEDWADTRDVLVIDRARCQLEHDWQEPQGRARLHRRRLRLRGEFAPGSSTKAGAEAYLVYAYPAPFAQPGAQPGARGTRLVRVIERHDDGVSVEETRAGDMVEWGDLPVAMTPGPPPRAGAQKGAIEEWGRALVAAFEAGAGGPGDPEGETRSGSRAEPLKHSDPVFDLMRRVPPRLRAVANADADAVAEPGLIDPTSAQAIAAGGSDDSGTIGAVIETLRQLDRSALAVQGPPGTGKTYLAARVIKALVERDGWCIGVVAQSHRVVENVLDGVVRAGLDSAQVGKVPQGGRLDPDDELPAYTVLRTGGHDRFAADHRSAGRGAVIGGTAWDFANETRVPRRSLDLLVVDEAGQFSLAPTIAASVSAERLLLLGDPQQLPQVSQGAHPEPVDTSALGWLLGEHETVPEGTGYFLSETRRMRPELADIVSELAYEGRLHAHPTAHLREVVGGGPAGLVWHPIAHCGNATSSPEEAAEAVRIVQGVLGGEQPATLLEPGRAPRPLTQSDLIVVAAYNAQVDCVSEALAAAGFSGVRVGTVDKFQGQEAVIAIVTLAASSAGEIPRGVEFLLMRNRLNVAISRAQWAAHLISSSQLGEGLPSTTDGLAALSGYLRLTERGSRTRLAD